MSKINWPDWHTVYEYWRLFDIPEVEVVAFEIGVHFPMEPWLKRTKNRQLNSSNPQIDTARHICNQLKTCDDELRALYKLYTFLVSRDFRQFRYNSLDKAWSVSGAARQFHWGINAKHLLPNVEFAPTARRIELEKLNWDDELHRRPEIWKQVVELCSLEWATIAEELAVIKIPQWMDFDSEERAKYDNYQKEQAEKLERLEYERLKRKYE